jgi:hypothetical protein
MRRLAGETQAMVYVFDREERAVIASASRHLPELASSLDSWLGSDDRRYLAVVFGECGYQGKSFNKLKANIETLVEILGERELRAMWMNGLPKGSAEEQWLNDYLAINARTDGCA